VAECALLRLVGGGVLLRLDRLAARRDGGSDGDEAGGRLALRMEHMGGRDGGGDGDKAGGRLALRMEHMGGRDGGGDGDKAGGRLALRMEHMGGRDGGGDGDEAGGRLALRKEHIDGDKRGGERETVRLQRVAKGNLVRGDFVTPSLPCWMPGSRTSSWAAPRSSSRAARR